MDKKELAAEAKVNRNTLAAIEAGESFNRTTLAKLERALDLLEEEAGIDSPAPPPSQSPKLVTFRLKDEHGIEVVVVEGPVENLAQMRTEVARLIREMRRES